MGHRSDPSRPDRRSGQRTVPRGSISSACCRDLAPTASAGAGGRPHAAAGLIFETQYNTERARPPEAQEKSIAPDAKALLLAHSWPGNVRELYHTLLACRLVAGEGKSGLQT